jgi:hypothetical protein
VICVHRTYAFARAADARRCRTPGGMAEKRLTAFRDYLYHLMQVQPIALQVQPTQWLCSIFFQWLCSNQLIVFGLLSARRRGPTCLPSMVLCTVASIACSTPTRAPLSTHSRHARHVPEPGLLNLMCPTGLQVRPRHHHHVAAVLLRLKEAAAGAQVRAADGCVSRSFHRPLSALASVPRRSTYLLPPVPTCPLAPTCGQGRASRARSSSCTSTRVARLSSSPLFLRRRRCVRSLDPA